MNLCSICHIEITSVTYHSKVKCTLCYAKEYRLKNSTKLKAIRQTPKFKEEQKSYQLSERGKEVRRKIDSSQKRKEYMKAFHKSEATKTKQREYRQSQSGKSIRLACQRERDAQKINAQPDWVNKEQIKEIYLNRPEGHHVDHIIPLKGKDVCGLHVPWNLQYLPAEENRSKGNKLLEFYLKKVA